MLCALCFSSESWKQHPTVGYQTKSSFHHFIDQPKKTDRLSNAIFLPQKKTPLCTINAVT
jgi:hypothetical protein